MLVVLFVTCLPTFAIAAVLLAIFVVLDSTLLLIFATFALMSVIDCYY